MIASRYAAVPGGCIGSATRFQRGYRQGEAQARGLAKDKECAARGAGEDDAASGGRR